MIKSVCFTIYYFDSLTKCRVSFVTVKNFDLFFWLILRKPKKYEW